MKKAVKSLKEFNQLFGIDYHERPNISDEKTRQLRYELMLEELNEYSDANNAYFESIEEDEKEKKNLFLVDIADSLGDQMYILIGTFVAHGLGDKVMDIFNEIHRSNMTKLCSSKEEAAETLKSHYERKKEEGYVQEMNVNGKLFFACRRTKDKKIIKSINYSQPNLRDIIKK